MRQNKGYKGKIMNDPVYGFISVGHDLIFRIIEHPYFQRLRRIQQLGLTNLVYPGAVHNRFQHSLGAMHLMHLAIGKLQVIGHQISEEEAVGAEIAMLLHDIGHGPFSHALEKSIVGGINHETLSRQFQHKLNREFGNELETAIQIFDNKHPKKFLSKLVASQLDMDRLDYLKRDSFFTGVAEGVINYERLLNMLNVVDDGLVIEAKGIYSVEKFITARRLMYWQVYLHKTVLAAEYMLMKILKRAKELAAKGHTPVASPALAYFLEKENTAPENNDADEMISWFAQLDDYDIMGALKAWKNHSDKPLSYLASGIVDRRLLRIEIQRDPFDDNYLDDIRKKTSKQLDLKDNEVDFFVFHDETSNYAYFPGPDRINILYKDGSVKDISEASDDLNISLLKRPTVKHFLCYPKQI